MSEEHDGHRHTADGGPIVLDVGDDIGALILHAEPHHTGLEIEISPIESPTHRHHVAIHPRNLDDHTIYAAVYPDLTHGTYQLWEPTGNTETPALTVTISGGTITEATWPR